MSVPGSVAGALVDHVEEGLAGVEPAQVLGKEGGRGIPMVRAKARGVRRDDDIRLRPQRVRAIERLVFEDVEPCPADRAVGQHAGQRRFVDELAPAHVDEDPVLLPESKMKRYMEGKTIEKEESERGDDFWIDAFRDKKQSPGSFLLAGPVSETINLGAVALRTGKKVIYDAAKMEITNVPDANKFLRREYRKGWEL